MKTYNEDDVKLLINASCEAVKEEYEKRLSVANILSNTRLQKWMRAEDRDQLKAEELGKLHAELETIRRIVGCEEGSSVSEAVAAMAKTLNESKSTERVYEFQLRKQGGPWLGAARKWLQHRRTTKGVHGDQVKWGDVNAIFEISAASVEDLAAEVAAAAFNEQGDKQATIERLRKKNLEYQFDIESLKAKIKDAQTPGAKDEGK